MFSAIHEDLTSVVSLPGPPLGRFLPSRTSPPSFFYHDLPSVVFLPGPQLRRFSTRTSPPSGFYQDLPSVVSLAEFRDYVFSG